MLPLLPVDVIHYILVMDVDACFLLRQVDKLSGSVRELWGQSPSVEVVDVDDDMDEISGRYVIGYEGFVSVIPVYSRFVRDWEEDGRVNPFDVDWTCLDLTDIHIPGFITDTLQGFQLLTNGWESDDNTRRCSLFKFIVRFTISLGRLLTHYNSMSALKSSVTA